MALDRIVALVDMDCFYVQVEQRKNPELRGKPCAVVQYKTWKGGGIIAVSYEARDFGVTRTMRGDEAKEKCPDITLVRVPEARGKANLTHYREAGAEVIAVLSRFCDNCERASVDEAYIDLTETVKIRMSGMEINEIAEKSAATTFLEGYMIDDGNAQTVDYDAWRTSVEGDEDICRLAVGAIIVSEMREAVLKETQFTCSAGIAHNKMLAKLGGGRHKPNKQTLLPQSFVPKLFETVPIKKVRNMGGKLGVEVRSSLCAEKMSDLAKYSLGELQARFGDKTGEWLYQLSQGVDRDPVRPRQLPKSLGCGKNFPGKGKLATTDQVKYWLEQLAGELQERLSKEAELNNREARLLGVSFKTEANTSFTRSCHLKDSSAAQIARDLYNLVLPFNSTKDNKSNTWYPGIVVLQISASKFEEVSETSTPSISSFFKKKTPAEITANASEMEIVSSALILNGSVADEFSSCLQDKISECSGSNKELTKRSETASNCQLDDKQSVTKRGIEAFFSECGKSSKLKDEQRKCRNPYQDCQIDCTVLKSLPDDIQREIRQSLVKSDLERSPRKQEAKFFSLQASSSVSRVCKDTQAEVDKVVDGARGSYSNETDLGDDELVKCEKCRMKFSPWEMPEHLDYHFAVDLQNTERNSSETLRCSAEPPKKKQKTTIQSFFARK
ncbi:DNA polymerase eta-like [Acropora muricata]|uniref:DNA polymerase eta-like n=1 Tax=Acropora muricata TaxID=159855 RepID=UPI0034E5821F